ncbi:MAG: carboxymuconolactone decarboxylase family protein [Spirochaetales bacterium]|nr:carboxymuconolactone decarboxylase family protein [Spirochaetales bacterium]
MTKKEENWAYFTKNHRDIFKAYSEFGKALHTVGGPLDEKQRWLIKVAVSAAGKHELALKTHVEKARTAGCTNPEIEHAILLTATTAGFPTMMNALMVFREML